MSNCPSLDQKDICKSIIHEITVNSICKSHWKCSFTNNDEIYTKTIFLNSQNGSSSISPHRLFVGHSMFARLAFNTVVFLVPNALYQEVSEPAMTYDTILNLNNI